MKKSRMAGGLVVVLLLLLLHPVAAQYKNGIPVLLYHHVSDERTDMPELTLSVAAFERQVKRLRDAGFESIRLSEFLEYMAGKEVALPERPILITFDDGYEDNYRYAFPVLKREGFRAVIFMVGINFDRKNRLTSAQIHEMQADGWEVGAHSMTHPDLAELTSEMMRREVTKSRRKVEQAARVSGVVFAYPGGHYSQDVMEAVEAAGYQGAFSVLSGLNHPERDHAYLLRRIPVFRSTDFDRLMRNLEENRPKKALLDYSL